jgi:hypothetical protein
MGSRKVSIQVISVQTSRPNFHYLELAIFENNSIENRKIDK